MFKYGLFGLFISTLASMAETLTLQVSTEGPRVGHIDILVFNSKEGFPNRPEQAFRRERFPVSQEGAVTCTITNLPYGEYSFSVMHDVNDNYALDKILKFGPPKEPVGFSNIEEKMSRKPTYESTLFTFDGRTNEIAISLWHVL